MKRVMGTVCLTLICGCSGSSTMDMASGGDDMAMAGVMDLAKAAGDQAVPPGSDLATPPGADLAGPPEDLTLPPFLDLTMPPVIDLAKPFVDMAAPPCANVGQSHDVHVGPGGLFKFDPPALSVKLCDKVHWIWDSNGHTVTSGTMGIADNKFCSPDNKTCQNFKTSAMGATFDHVFNAAGSYPYYCGPHANAGMTATITVQ